MDDIGPWRLSLGRGETTFLGLTELDNIFAVLAALHEMTEAEMKCIVLERLYAWHASNTLAADEWLGPRAGTGNRRDWLGDGPVSYLSSHSRVSLPGNASRPSAYPVGRTRHPPAHHTPPFL